MRSIFSFYDSIKSYVLEHHFLRSTFKKVWTFHPTSLPPSPLFGQSPMPSASFPLPPPSPPPSAHLPTIRHLTNRNEKVLWEKVNYHTFSISISYVFTSPNWQAAFLDSLYTLLVCYFLQQSLHIFSLLTLFMVLWSLNLFLTIFDNF